MPYALGIDLGTSFTAAAVQRWTSPDDVSVLPAEPVTLGSASLAVPTVVHLDADGGVLVAEAALRRSAGEPDRVVREFKRRIGDEVPLVVAGRAVAPADLAALVARWVVDLVTAREGAAPHTLAVTHPATWGAHRIGLMRDALGRVGLEDVRFSPEPVAAAVHYATRTDLAAGSTVAVYDLGGGTFDAALVRTDGSGGAAVVGSPAGLEDLGGADIDEAVITWVLDALGDELPSLDPRESAVAGAVERLQRECVEAKEVLSADTEATIPVLLPGVSTRVRLVRAELEEMLAEPLARTVEVLMSTLDSAHVERSQVTSVLLVGGSSRIPLVAEVVSAALGRPVTVDADPKLTIALGAARSAWLEEAARAADAAAVAEPDGPVGTVDAAADDADARSDEEGSDEAGSDEAGSDEAGSDEDASAPSRTYAVARHARPDAEELRTMSRLRHLRRAGWATAATTAAAVLVAVAVHAASGPTGAAEQSTARSTPVGSVGQVTTSSAASGTATPGTATPGSAAPGSVPATISPQALVAAHTPASPRRRSGSSPSATPTGVGVLSARELAAATAQASSPARTTAPPAPAPAAPRTTSAPAATSTPAVPAPTPTATPTPTAAPTSTAPTTPASSAPTTSPAAKPDPGSSSGTSSAAPVSTGATSASAAHTADPAPASTPAATPATGGATPASTGGDTV